MKAKLCILFFICWAQAILAGNIPTNSEQGLLQSIANQSDKLAGVTANNILCFHYGVCKTYPPILPLTNNQQRKAKSQLLSEESGLKVYPNPANSFIVFDYSKVDISSTMLIEISDMTGKLIEVLPITDKEGFSVWNTQTVINGVYLYKLVREGFPSVNGKFVVQH